jgi:hypothetical protein
MKMLYLRALTWGSLVENLSGKYALSGENRFWIETEMGANRYFNKNATAELYRTCAATRLRGSTEEHSNVVDS